MRKTSCLFFLTFLALGIGSTQAVSLYSQDFEGLTPGSLNGQAGFLAPSGAAVESGGLSYTSGAVSVPGGSQNATFNGTSANNWAITNTFAAQSGTVYFSLAMTWTNQSASSFLYFALSNIASTASVPLQNSGGIVINGFGGTNAGTIGGRIRNDTSANTTQTSSGVNSGVTTTSTQFIVASLSKVASVNFNTLNLFVNPTSTTEGVPTLTITRDMGISSGLNTFYYFTGGSDPSSETIKVDNINIGTTYADVVNAAVPEPGTSVMLLGGFGLLIAFRRVFRSRVA